MKNRPYRAIWLIAGLWSLWMIPLVIFSPHIRSGLNLLLMVAYNFALTPLLIYFRIKGKAIATAALFYASLQAASLFFQMLLPLPDEMMWVYELARIFCLFLYALILGLYSPRYWVSQK